MLHGARRSASRHGRTSGLAAWIARSARLGAPNEIAVSLPSGAAGRAAPQPVFAAPYWEIPELRGRYARGRSAHAGRQAASACNRRPRAGRGSLSRYPYPSASDRTASRAGCPHRQPVCRRGRHSSPTHGPARTALVLQRRLMLRQTISFCAICWRTCFSALPLPGPRMSIHNRTEFATTTAGQEGAHVELIKQLGGIVYDGNKTASRPASARSAPSRSRLPTR